jgi:hypothetical protein
MSLSEQRTDITQSFEDFERVMEDYFQVIPPDIDFFKIEKATHWSYDDMENSVSFWFEDDWTMQEFKDNLEECPLWETTFDADAFDGIDWQEKRITVIGHVGGLLG